MEAKSPPRRSQLIERSPDEVQRLNRRLGLINGFILGLALALGAWGYQASTFSRLPIRSPYGSIFLASVLIILLTTFVGWLTAAIGKTILTTLFWFVAAVIVSTIVGVQASSLSTLVTWLSDRRFWGLSAFPLEDASLLSFALGGFFILLALTVLGFVEEFRLDGIQAALGIGGRLSTGAAFLLLIPLPFVALAAYITTSNDPAGGASVAGAAGLVHEAIQTGRSYEGDLFALSLEKGLNYSAINGVREQLDGDYTLSIGEIDEAAASTIVVARFENGAWIHCRIINGQLSFCFDASPPFTIGLSSLITGAEVPEDCLRCVPELDENLRGWLRERRDELSVEPQITFLGQEGSYVLMEASSPAGDYAVECLFSGMSTVRLQSCTEVE